MTSVIVIDDAAEDRDWISALAKQSGEVAVHTYRTGAEGIAHFKAHGSDCIFLNNRLSGEDGLSVLMFLIAVSPFAKVVMITDQGSEDLAATAVKAGAMGYLPKEAISSEIIAQLIKEAVLEAQKDRGLMDAEIKAVHVLLVEDNDQDLTRIKDMIEQGSASITVSSVATEGEALELLSTGSVDCAILDYQLEVDDGLDILAKLREISPFTPVIILSGQGNEEIAANSIKVGAADYLIKQRLTATFLHKAIDIAISRATLEAKLADQEAQRRQFLRTLVHDLRAPLRNVRNIGEMAIEEAEQGELGEMKSLLISQGALAARATDLIDTLENYALLDSEVTLTPIELEDAAKAAAANLAGVISECNAEVTIAKLPRVSGHLPQLTQLFQNLIGNGLKYNQQDVPRITIETNMGDSGDEALVVVVKDNGIGIPAKHHRHIFEPLKRLWGQDSYEGTGLGLAICKKVVERHGGQIWCMSQEEEGSQFYVSFPHLTKTP